MPHKPNNKELSIVPNDTSELTKEQKDFNHLIDRMRKAEIKLEQERILLDSLLNECIQKVYPLHRENVKLEFNIITELYNYFSSNPYSAIRRRTFIDFLNELIDNLLFSPHGLTPEESDKITEIYSDLNQVVKKNNKNRKLSREEQFIQLQVQLEEELIDRGYSIDLSELNIDMTRAEIDHYIEEKINAFNEKRKNDFKKDKKKTKKQIEEEIHQQELEDLKGKSLSVMYKSLAKILHPDLEQNPEKKIQKEHWMKKLTVAYNKKDLKTLLEIELEWALGESGNIQSLTKEKLKLYNEMLRSQTREMEIQAATVYSENKYVLLSYFAESPMNIKRWRPAFSIKKLQRKKMNSEIILEILEKRDANTKKLIDKVIKNHRSIMDF